MGSTNQSKLNQTPIQAPPTSYSIGATTAAGQSIACNGLSNVDFSGVGSFAFAGMFRIPAAPSANAPFFSGNGQFYLSVTPGMAVTGGFTGGTSLSSIAGTLPVNQWFYMVVTYTGSAAGSLLTIYMDNNAEVALGAVTPSNGSSNSQILLLSGLTAQVTNFTVFQNIEDAVTEPDDPDTPEDLIADWDFSSGPYVDRSGNNNTVTFNNGAAQYWMTPSLVTGTSGGGALQPAAADALNFPGTGNEAFSICQWCYTTPSSSQEFYSVNLNGEPEFYINTPGGQVNQFSYEVGIAQQPLLSTQSMHPADWTYVAVVWQPATNGSQSSLSLSVNGGEPFSAVDQSLPDVTSYSAIIGQGLGQNAAPQYICGVSAWNVALTQAEIQTYMNTQDPANCSGCVASFPMTTDATDNTLTGNAFTLTGDAVLSEQSLPLAQMTLNPNLAPSEASPADSSDVMGVTLSDILAHAQSLGIDPNAVPPASVVSASDLANEVSALRSSFSSLPQNVLDVYITRFQQYRSIGAQLAAKGDMVGMFTASIQGSDCVYYYHTTAGPQEVGREPASAEATGGGKISCAQWAASVAASVLGVFFAAVGVRFSASKLLQACVNKVGPVGVAVFKAATGITASSTIQYTWSFMLKVLGCMAYCIGATIWEAIVANWFSVACLCASTILFFLSFLNPVTAAYRVAAAMGTLALSIANLLSVVVQPHQACTQGN